MLADMTAEEWLEIQAMDTISPIGHGTRMLGHLAHMVMSYMTKDVTKEQLREAFLPWMDSEECDVSPVEAAGLRRMSQRLGI